MKPDVEQPILTREYGLRGGDMENAGVASISIKKLLGQAGVQPGELRRASVACFEAEMNVLMYARTGVMRITLYPTRLKVEVEDFGPGIQNIELAFQEGFSTSTQQMRDMGFGAGMGLPNIRRNVDEMQVASEPGQGTVLWFDVVFREALRVEAGDAGDA